MVKVGRVDAGPTDIARMQGQERLLACQVLCLNGQSISTATLATYLSTHNSSFKNGSAQCSRLSLSLTE